MRNDSEDGTNPLTIEATLKMLESSKFATRLLENQNERQSLINQGDIYNQRRNEKEAVRLANFDAQRVIPDQIWYDSLRKSDDGSFCK